MSGEKVCISCNKKCTKENFSKRQWRRKDPSCLSCSELTNSPSDMQQAITGGERGRGTTATIRSAVASTSPTAILDDVMVFNRVLSDGTVSCYDGALEEAFNLLTTTAAVGTTVTVAAASAATNTAAAATAATTATSASDIYSCSHGITSDHFPDGRTYKSVILDYLSAVSAVSEEGMEFALNHIDFFTNPYFAHYIFAVCTSWYLKTNRTTMEMRDLILRALDIKYLFEPKFHSEPSGGPGPEYDKIDRYKRAIRMMIDDRGVINCLSRETKAYCKCMNDKKTEADSMAKVEYCSGCEKFFPRAGMLKCSGCNFEFYCNVDCYKKSWPKHKEFCQDMQKANFEERKLQQELTTAAALRESTQTEEL